MTSKPALQKIPKRILQTEDENKHSYERIGISESQEKSRQVIRK
jgi:hypothetical protein